MNTKIILVFLSLFGMNALSVAQEPPSSTNRSEGLKIKAKMDYEKKAQPQETQAVKVDRKVPQQPNSKPTEKPAPAAPPVAESGRSESSKSLTCKNGNEVRELLLEYKGLGCDLVYVKAGQSKSQAHQNNGSTICESVYEKMKATLEKTGFACESKKD